MTVSPILRRRPWLALAALVLVVVAGTVAIPVGRDDPEEVSETFCHAFGDLEVDLARIERVLGGEGTPDDLSLASHQGVAGMWWSDHVALGGPPESDRDALRIARAVRSSLEEASVGPLRAPEVLAAQRRVAPVAAEACEGVLE